jgi:hypothetical protein
MHSLPRSKLVAQEQNIPARGECHTSSDVLTTRGY